MATFGEQLVATRERLGWSRNRLHQRTELAQSYLHGVENDHWLPGHDNLKKIVAVLGPESNHLLEERDRIEYERLGLDPETTVDLKEISEGLTERDREELAAVTKRIKQRQRRRDH